MVLLINSAENPVAQFDEPSFKGDWQWIEAPPDRDLAEAAPADTAPLDAVIVFATRYQPEDTLRLCEAVRRTPRLAPLPLLLAVDRYEMPVANRVREWPNADYIVTPIEEPSLITHLQRAVDSKSP